jgi:tRNA(Arg) A34 adenosine deaminase TadA
MIERNLRKKIWHYFQIAAEVASSKHPSRHFLHGAVAIRKDGVLVKALNSPTKYPDKNAHAERRLSKKLTKDSIVYVVRIKLANKSFSNSKPCKACELALKSRGVKRVYYSISNNEFGVLDL